MARRRRCAAKAKKAKRAKGHNPASAHKGQHIHQHRGGSQKTAAVGKKPPKC